ncbi:glycoside hydrolase family 2 protein [Enterococcus sp. LJL98]
MERKQRINDQWFFSENYRPNLEKETALTDFEAVQLPHNTVALPYQYFDEKSYQKKTCYFRKLHLNPSVRNFVRFEGVMAVAEVYLNGEHLLTHKGGYTPFEVELPDVHPDSLLAVVVDSSEREDVPPFGGAIDYLTYGGIYRDVFLIERRGTFIEEPFFAIENIESTTYRAKLHFQTEVPGNLQILLTGEDLAIEGTYQALSGENTFEFPEMTVTEWSPENPTLYELTILEEEDLLYHEKVGFRRAEFTSEGFYLNGENYPIIGLNRHQDYPYVGYAMPEEWQVEDVRILKHELGLNMVRTSHYPQSPAFIAACDELGLLVFEEIPGWQHIGEGEWHEVLLQNVAEMVLRDRNHPSIVLWGVRVNESDDHHALYTQTNELCRKLDPTRQTGGVRYLEKSEFLEDVYTMNDFSYDGGDTIRLKREIEVATYDNVQVERKGLRTVEQVVGEKVPYLVTEYAGHMYPTKRFDQEERLIEHAMRHAVVVNAAYENPNISGAVGWCAFDYHTHENFGSGDRLCYHGVMDNFRVSKFAASVYASQQDPKQNPVMVPLTNWTRGDRNMAQSVPIYVFTNCDEIEVRYNGKSRGFYQREADGQFNHLPYPPIVLKEFNFLWGEPFGPLDVIGYLDGEVVAVKEYTNEPVLTDLVVEASHEVLVPSDRWAATKITMRVVDQKGNLLPFLMGSVRLENEGGEVIGGNEVPLIGGSAVCWVRTLPDTNEIKLTAKYGTFEKTRLIKVEKA